MMKSVLIIGKNSLGGVQRCSYPAVSAFNAQSVRMFAQVKAKKDDKKTATKDKEAAPKEKKKPVNAQKKKKVVNEQQGHVDAIYHFLHTAEDARRIKLKFTDEELEENKRIAKEYQRQCGIYERAMNRDLADKIWLQQEALRALPAHLFEHASTIDETPPPADRPWPKYDTPPIKGFNAMDYVEKKKTTV